MVHKSENAPRVPKYFKSSSLDAFNETLDFFFVEVCLLFAVFFVSAFELDFPLGLGFSVGFGTSMWSNNVQEIFKKFNENLWIIGYRIFSYVVQKDS